MGRRMNFAPRWPTILVGIALALVGVLGTFVGVIPTIAGVPGDTIGVWAYVASAVVLIAGILIQGI